MYREIDVREIKEIDITTRKFFRKTTRREVVNLLHSIKIDENRICYKYNIKDDIEDLDSWIFRYKNISSAYIEKDDTGSIVEIVVFFKYDIDDYKEVLNPIINAEDIKYVRDAELYERCYLPNIFEIDLVEWLKKKGVNVIDNQNALDIEDKLFDKRLENEYNWKSKYKNIKDKVISVKYMKEKDIKLD